MDDLPIRLVYLYNIVGAGAVGALVLAAPRVAARYVFAGRTEPNAATSILGAIWFAVGLASVLGLFYPRQFAAILLVQFVYKLLWLLAVAAPALLAGRVREATPPVMTAMFVVWVVVLPFAIPFGQLFGS